MGDKGLVAGVARSGSGSRVISSSDVRSAVVSLRRKSLAQIPESMKKRKAEKNGERRFGSVGVGSLEFP